MVTPPMAIMKSVMTKLQNTNPQGFQFIDQAMRSGGNPQALLNQMLGNASPEQKQSLLTQAKNYGCPDNILKQIQDMK